MQFTWSRERWVAEVSGSSRTGESSSRTRWEGEALAQHNLGDMYLRGDGVAQNDATALSLFQNAAIQGHTGAQIKLGYMLAEGRGTQRDVENGLAWIVAASIAGDSRGEPWMHSLERQLSPAQLSRAKDHARALRQHPGQQLSATAFVQ